MERLVVGIHVITFLLTMAWLSDRYTSPTNWHTPGFPLGESLLSCLEVLNCGQCFFKGRIFLGISDSKGEKAIEEVLQ